MGAGEALQAAAMTALGTIDGLGIYEGPPVQAVYPYAVIEAGPESDWSHKTGQGRDVRFAVTLRDRGERPVRLRALMDQSETALATLSGNISGWQLVTMLFLRSKLVREPTNSGQIWAAMIEYRALMMRI
jgi:hypothetical protein